MAKKFVLFDDYDGKELPEDTQPIRLTLGRRGWNLYLSDASTEALYKALNKFTDGAEEAGQFQETTPQTASQPRKRAAAAPRTAADGPDSKVVRKWAQENNIPDNNGNLVKDRGRIKPEIVEAYLLAIKEA